VWHVKTQSPIAMHEIDVIWIAWFNGTLHHELHGRNDARGRTLFLLQILVLVPIGAFIPEAGGARVAALQAQQLLAGLGIAGRRDDRAIDEFG
jgi:hypothetical protein